MQVAGKASHQSHTLWYMRSYVMDRGTLEEHQAACRAYDAAREVSDPLVAAARAELGRLDRRAYARKAWLSMSPGFPFGTEHPDFASLWLTHVGPLMTHRELGAMFRARMTSNSAWGRARDLALLNVAEQELARRRAVRKAHWLAKSLAEQGDKP